MSRRPQLTQDKLDEMRAAYEDWNPYAPGAPTADEIAEQFGITKSTLYTWRRRGWQLDGRDGDGRQGWKERADSPAHTDADLSSVVVYLTEQLVSKTVEVEELKAKLQAFEERLNSLPPQ